jgi:hypothetical protein
MACTGATINATAEIAAIRCIAAIAVGIHSRYIVGIASGIRYASMRGEKRPHAESKKQNTCYKSDFVFNHDGHYTHKKSKKQHICNLKQIQS